MKETREVDRLRLIGVALFVFLLFGLLVAQFYRIQILEGDKWTVEAARQHYFVVTEPYHRGIFYSNTSIKKGHPSNPQPLVIDVQKFHLYVDPLSIPEENRNEISDALLRLIDPALKERKVLREQFDKHSRSRKLSMWLDADTKDLLLQWWLPYAREKNIPRNALFFISDYQRSYPFGKLLGQVLHTVQLNKDDKTQGALPTGGLELYFQSYLEGRQGKRKLMRSPRNALEMGEVITMPQNGADIHLTINHYLQAIAEEEIEKGVKKAKGKSGWAVMMDPYTGDILAMAQYPFFYPPEYRNYFNDPLQVENTRLKALTDANEPGSIFKPFSVAIALMANEELRKKNEALLFDPEEKIGTANGVFPGRSKPIRDTRFHRYLNMYMALQKSSNIYMGRLIERVIARMGNGWYRNVLNQTFGFGKRTNVEYASETSGVLPTPGKMHPNGKLEWSVPTPFSIAMGHNIQVNSLQMVRAYAILANGGYLVQPTFIRKIEHTDEYGKIHTLVDNTLPARLKSFPKVLDEKIIAEVVKAMKYATKQKGGECHADIHGYTEAGKTSTAEKIVNGGYSKTQHFATFVGFAPVAKPAFVLLVSIDEPEYGFIPGIGKSHFGGTCAAPIFREIGKRTLEYLGISPDDPYGYPAGDPRYDPEKADWVPQTRQLQELYQTWNK